MQLQDEVQNQKAMAAVDEFIENKINETSIVIDPIFKECDFTRASWKQVALKSAE